MISRVNCGGLLDTERLSMVDLYGVEQRLQGLRKGLDDNVFRWRLTGDGPVGRRK